MEILKKIMLLYYDINNIYMELFKLELSDQKDSELFKKIIIILKSKLIEEDTLLKLLYDSDEYDSVCEYISKEDNLMFIRLRNYINYYANTNIEICEEDTSDMVREIELLNKSSKLYACCNKNIFLIYLSFLQEYLEIEDSVREPLLNLKYYNSFVNNDMEKVLIDNNFVVGVDNYVDIYLIARMLDIDTRLRDEIILDTYLNVIIGMIQALLSIMDCDRIDIEQKAISVNAECMLKAVLALLSDRDYKKIEQNIVSTINELSNNDNQISLSIINSYIDNRKKYKTRVKKLSSGNICE